MTLGMDQIKQTLAEESFATVVTKSGDGLASRTMLFAYDSADGIYLLTQKVTHKVGQIAANAEGLVHLGRLTEDLVSSFDISMQGQFRRVESGAPEFGQGTDLLAAKNGQIRALMGSAMADDYVMFRFQVESIEGWTYQQALDGQPKTNLSLGSANAR